MEKIPLTICHYSAQDPFIYTGGVEAFARNLSRVFETVIYLTPNDTESLPHILQKGTPIVCDNHHCLTIPEEYPVIAFQHGVANTKFSVTKKSFDRDLAILQQRAAYRKNTLWVACARWISDTFEASHGNKAYEVIYHPIDTERFRPIPERKEDNLILHDARTNHKGAQEVEFLSRHFPQYRFEGLNCMPEYVPERFQQAAAFLHLSKYEGNSIVCNEAMAMDLPCFFNQVGLFRDDSNFDVYLRRDHVKLFWKKSLKKDFQDFSETILERKYNPRLWILEHATYEIARNKWQRVLDYFVETYRYASK